MTAVEPDDEVRSIACEYFGAPGDWGELVGGCGAEAVAAARDGSFDIVVVDAADGGNAPPDALASPAFFADVGRVLTEPAVLAVNVVARDAETLARVRDAAACVGGELLNANSRRRSSRKGLSISHGFCSRSAATRGRWRGTRCSRTLTRGELWMRGLRGLVTFV